jgi:hypothetical protein
LKNLILTFVVFLLADSARAQTGAGPANSTAVFPGVFLGKWKGALQWIVAGRPTQTFTMQLSILPADTAGQFTWQMMYGEDGKDSRPYLLKPVDTSRGHWLIDERDGILLDSYVFDSSLQGAFTVMGNTIVDHYRVEGDKMLVEFFTIKLDDKKTSGKGTAETPLVHSYRMSGYQRGVLQKQD